MIIGRLHVSFDRGTATNRANDLGLAVAPTTTEEGLVVRGLGTHYRSAEAKGLAKERSNEEARVRSAFKRVFVTSPIPGTYVLPRAGEGAKVLAALDPPIRVDVEVSVSEYVLDVLTQAPAEVKAWAGRVEKQIQDVPLGRGKGKDWADTAGGVRGISILEGLAACPVIGQETRQELLTLIADAKLQRLDRVTLKRKLDGLTVDINAPAVKPRRAPVTPDLDADLGPAVKPRRSGARKTG